MKLAVKRANMDFGNSFLQAMVNGFYYEFATNVVELEEEEAEGYFTDSVSEGKEFLDRMLIATKWEGKKRYYLVGKSAQNHTLGNQHADQLHNKVKSHVPYISFLSGFAYYYSLKFDEVQKGEGGKQEEHVIEADYFSTMLPIWLLKQKNKFSEMQNEMAQRFIGDHEVEILTAGLEKTIVIHVKESKCRTESEVARWAIKKNFDLTDKDEARQFEKFKVIMVDLGGGTVDLALLQPGLLAPASRNDLKCITDIAYLEHIEKLRNEKLLEHFSDLRSLEKFIYENVHKGKMIRKYENTGESVDLTKEIHDSLRQYTKILVTKIEHAYPASGDEVYKYLYFGGVAYVLKKFIQDELQDRYNEQIVQDNHFFPEEPRKLNVYALEVLSINETQNAA